MSEFGRLEFLAGVKGRLPGPARELVPRADRETVVAAIDAIAHGGAQVARDMPLVLDGEIGDAAPGIELVGRGEGICGADVEAAAAGPAAVPVRRIGREFEGGEDGAEEEPGAEVAADEVRVLALPAESRRGGERLLHHRRGIDEDLHAGVEFRHHPARERLEAFLDQVMIVAIAGIDRDRAARGPRERGEGVFRGAVVHPQHDDRAHLGPERARVAPPVRFRREPVHVALPAEGEKAPETQPRRLHGIGRGDARGIEAEPQGFPPDPLFDCDSVGQKSSFS